MTIKTLIERLQELDAPDIVVQISDGREYNSIHSLEVTWEASGDVKTVVIF